MHDCEAFRDIWLEGALDQELQAMPVNDGCVSCETWSQRSKDQILALRSLPSLELPSTHVAGTSLSIAFATPETTPLVELRDELAGALAKLSKHRAPQALDLLVAKDLAAQDLELTPLESLSELAAYSSPSVLDRLVEEELSAPLAYQSARIMGRMEALAAPPELDALVEEALVGERLAVKGTNWRAWSTFLAACLVGWIAVRSFSNSKPTPGRRFVIVHATSLSELSPLARSHMEALGGSLGSLPSINSLGGGR